METHARKKILFLITKSNLGGAQRYVYDLATGLDTATYESVVALGGNGVLIDMLKKKGIRIIQIPSLERDISTKKELVSFWQINKILKNEQPDIIHVNSSKAGGIGAFLGRLHGVPKIIYTAHGWAFNEDRGFISRAAVTFFHWLTVLLSHTTIVVSETTKSQMDLPLIASKMKVIHNGRRPPHFLSREDARKELVEIAPQLKKWSDALWTGTIAELHPVKQHNVALAAVKELVKGGTSLHHIIIGDGELKDALERKIIDEGLTDHVFCVGHIHEAARLLKAFDIFVLPSRSEALAYAVIEAKQAELPIIASDVGGIPEIISDKKNGLLVPSGDIQALAQALRTLIADKDLRSRYAEAAFTSSEYFSLARMLRETENIYCQE